MKGSKAARTAAQTKATVFEVGQMWKIGDMHLAVTSVGKTLVHYKQYKTQPRGIHTRLCSKPELEKYLADNNAALVTE